MTGGDDQITGAAAVALSASSPSVAAPAAPADGEALLGLAACHDLALEVARMATFELDATTDTLTWSAAAPEVIGCDADEVDAHLRWLLAPIAVSPTSLRADYELEQRLVTDGQERFVQVRARGWPSAAQPGRVGVFGVITDVTDRRHSEQEMVDLVDRYRLLVELSPDAIAVHEAGVVRYVNSAACRLARTTADELRGASILRFVEPDDTTDLLERLARLDNAGASVTAQATMLAFDGTRRRMEVVSVRTTWEGRPAFQVIMRDLSERDRAEAALRSQAELVAAVSDAIVAFDADDVITSWNPAAERIFGWSTADATGRTLRELADPFVLDGVDDLRGALDPVTRTFSGELTAACADGSSVPVHVSVSALPSAVDHTEGLVAVFSDQSERLAAEAERARAEARFSTVVAALHQGVAVTGADGRVQSFNAAAERILGRRGSSLEKVMLSGQGLHAIDEHGRQLSETAWPVQKVLALHEPVTDRTIGVRRPDGALVWLRMSARPLHSDDGSWDLAGVVCSFVDITEQRRSALELAHAATHDALTDLPNWAAMRTEIDTALKRIAEDPTATPVAVLFCDLDRFKEVNDSLGHPVGDTVLCEVAARLQQLTPPGASIGRLGGDEFIVVAGDLAEDDAIRLAQGIVDELCRPLEVHVHDSIMSVTIGASVGVAFSRTAAPELSDSAELLRAADVALFRAKARGRNRVEVFDPSMPDAARLRLETREDLRLAIETGQLAVHYQPLWRASIEDVTCTPAGFEALARWDHPVRGRQNPADFIALAEETGLIESLGAYVLEKACEQLAEWRALGHDLYVSVNLSARQLSDPNLLRTVQCALDRSGLPAEALWLELTESALADEAIDAAAVLRDLTALGVRISIDDFGTGYSSLGRLRHLPISALKIDRSFVADMNPSSAPDGVGDEGVIVESTIGLAHRLGLVVIAEGVETPEQLARLAELDCELVQGFLLGRPVAPEDVELHSPDC